MLLMFILEHLLSVLKSIVSFFLHRKTKQIELKMERRSNSLDIASRIEESHRIKRIESTNILWRDFLHIKNELTPLIDLLSSLTDDEFNSVITNDLNQESQENKTITSILKEYSSFEYITVEIEGGEVMSLIRPSSGDEPRIFVSERLWSIYYCMERLHIRFGNIINRVRRFGGTLQWRNDQILKDIVLIIFPEETWEIITGRDFGGLKNLIILLEREFVRQAKKDIRNIEELADSFSIVEQIATEEEKNSYQM